MKFKFLLAPAIAATVAAGANADEMLSLDEAIARIYPNETLIPADFKLSSGDYTRLKYEYRVPSIRPRFKAWKTEAGDWLFLDQVWGRDDVVTYMLGVNAQGKITGLEVLICAEGYCEEVYTPQWMAQMEQVTHGRWMPGDVVPLTSGSTLSTKHVAEGVKKLLAIHARYLPQDE